jgi:hypothetical protein
VRPYFLVVIGLLTYTLQQNGYRAAGLAAFLPVFSVLDPAVGSLLGLALYHEHLGGGPVRMAAEAAAVIAATWGIARLARSTAAAKPIESPEPDSVGALLTAPAASAPTAHPAIQVIAQVPVPIAVPVPAPAMAAEETSAPSG